jgi:hypothetical protein
MRLLEGPLVEKTSLDQGLRKFHLAHQDGDRESFPPHAFRLASDDPKRETWKIQVEVFSRSTNW